MTPAGDPSLGLHARLTLHDLADPADGYPDYAALEFLPISARVVRAPGRTWLQLDDAQLVRITSLSPLTDLEHAASWHVQAGAVTLDDDGCHRCTAARISGGGGVALASAGGGLVGWLTADAQVVTARGLRGIAERAVRAGLGPAAGVRARLSADSAVVVTGEWIWLPAQPTRASYQVAGVVRWRFGHALALALAATYANAGLAAQLGVWAYY